MVEILLAVAIFALFGTIMLSAFIYGRDGVRQAGDRVRATDMANGGVEVVRNLANPNYSNLSSFSNGTTYYINSVNNQWQLTSTPQLIDNKYTRTVVFSDGPNGSREVNITVSWPENTVRTGTVNVNTYFANWRQATASPNKTGLFIYADGGTSTDVMKFRQLQLTGIWTDPTNIPDVDAATTNRVARSTKLYSAKTGSAKMALTRHFDGTKQYLYATLWNGSSWNTPQLLAQWISTAYLDVGNFSGDYTADGSFFAVYSDGSNAPKSRIFNGSNWGAQTSLGAIDDATNFPTNVIVRSRPQTNEVMAAFLDYNFHTNTNYYSNGSWKGYNQHAVNSVGNNSKQIDFEWSSIDTTKGVLLFTNITTDRSLRIRTFNADGLGNGNWNPVANSKNQPSGSVIGSLSFAPRPNTAGDFVACDKDKATPPAIWCYKVSPGSSSFTYPTNNLITSDTASGLQLSFDLGYKGVNSDIGVILYSDNTPSAKLKRYYTDLDSWDASSALSLPNATSVIQKTRFVPRPNTNEAMMIVADSNRNLYSVMFDGATDSVFTTPTGKAWTTHNTSGPSNNAVWFDFAWDN